MSSDGTIPKNILTRLREESAAKRQKPTKEEIEALLRKKDTFDWILNTFDKKYNILNFRGVQERNEKATALYTVLQERYAHLFPKSLQKSHPPVIFEFIFVRHGESCANAIHHGVLGGTLYHKQYLDPELTQKGAYLSERKHADLVDAFGSGPFANNDFIIGSSALLRAQETAHLMISKQSGLPVNIMPYLGEVNHPEMPFHTDDNFPRSPPEQMARLEVLTGGTFQKGFDMREKEYAPSLKSFFEWAIAHQDVFPVGKDGVRRAILFTHSNLLQKAFDVKHLVDAQKGRISLTKDKLANNDFLVTIYNKDKLPAQGKTFLDSNAVYPEWRYFDTRSDTAEIPCGFERQRCKQAKNLLGRRIQVPVTPPCTGGGKRKKTRRSRKRHTTRKH